MIRKALILVGLGCGILLFSVLLLYLFVVSGLSGPLPSKSHLREIQSPQASKVLLNDGSVLGLLYTENRSAVHLEACPEYLINALVSTEDTRFFGHRGVDYRSLGRVFFKGFLFASSSGGGSTITQQLAKNLFPRKRYIILSTPVNKLREIIIARRIERISTKEQILEQYLNTVSFGELTFGISTASKRFFNKTPEALLHEEAATLVGILKAPTYYSPRRFPERTRERRNVVLAQMTKYEKITQELYDSLAALPLKIAYTPDQRPSELSGYFLAHIERQSREILEEIKGQIKGEIPDVRVGGLKIYTTLDRGIQKHAESAVRTQMPKIQARFSRDWGQSQGDWESQAWLETELKALPRYQIMSQNGLSHADIIKSFEQETEMMLFSWGEAQLVRDMSVVDSLRYYKKLMQAGFIAIDPETGFVKAWIGGIDHRYFPYDHVLARRQSGSTFKPIVYATAFETGADACKYYDNSRITFTEYDDWSPRNSNRHYTGCYSIQGGLAYSVNTVAAQILHEVGIPATIGMARRLGIQSEIPSVPSIALGTAELRLDEITAAYTAFSNGGYYVTPICILKIEDSSGNTIYQYEASTTRIPAISDTVATEVLESLQIAVDSGTAQALRTVFRIDGPIAGKTGTTQQYADGWFVGISPGLVTGVWIGADDPRVHFRTGVGAGGQTALPVYGEFLRALTTDPAYAGPGKSGLSASGTNTYTISCPLYSDLNAAEMAALLEAQKEGDSWFLPNLLESLFSKKDEDSRQFEQRIMRQMQEKLDKTATRMRKRRKSPVAISRALDEIRKEYYDRLKEEKRRRGDN